MTTSLDPVPSVRATIKAYLQLEIALAAARAIQWTKAPRGSSDGEPRHPEGHYADPTAEAVLDTQRSTVSDQVRHTERLLKNIYTAIKAETAHVNGAIDQWEGKAPQNSRVKCLAQVGHAGAY